MEILMPSDVAMEAMVNGEIATFSIEGLSYPYCVAVVMEANRDSGAVVASLIDPKAPDIKSLYLPFFIMTFEGLRAEVFNKAGLQRHDAHVAREFFNRVIKSYIQRRLMRND